MPRRKAAPTQDATDNVADYRYADKRKNIPPAGLAAQGRVSDVPPTRYAYDPHLPPVLRFDDSGAADRLPDLLDEARRRPLTDAEARLLAEALRHQQPWLEWAGKREKRWFEVDPVALHIHERVSAQAVLKLARRQPLQRALFADPELEYRDAVKFYAHDMAWANRLILGDSLVVMNSLAKREDLAGKVQMIYIDPPYGIKFASNFQAQVGKRDVKDKDEDLTREPEVVKAYRDTWTLGVHSYLAYLRDRLVAARDLLTDSGSIFVQIGDENLHHVREVLDEVFGVENLCASITVVKTAGQSSELIASVSDYVLWYAKSRGQVRFHQTYRPKQAASGELGHYGWVHLPSGEDRGLTARERDDLSLLPQGSRLYAPTSLISQGATIASEGVFAFAGQEYHCGAGNHWKTSAVGMIRLAQAERIHVAQNSVRFIRYLDDFPAIPHNNVWEDTATGNFTEQKLYVVQTATKIIQRCMLMTTDPGDLVLDPTCGSGTTAYVAEQWGRRWITIDTSRVAVALARQRLLTAKFDYYELADADKGVAGGFVYKTVPHITLKSIAQNPALDPVFARWEPVLAEKLAALNAALAQTPAETRTRLQAKLAEKERREGKRAVTDADRRRWLLPQSWQAWEVPYDSDPDWPQPLQAALDEYRAAWRGKMDEVNAVIAASAETEKLVDQPRAASGILRVSGPFTVEGVQPVEETLDGGSPIGGEPDDDLQTFDPADEPSNAEAYLDKMLRLLRQDGVRFPDNKVAAFDRLEPVLHSILHAVGEWSGGRRVAVSFGPQYGPITAKQVEDCLRAAARGGYDDLVLAGFTVDAAAQAIIQDDPNPNVHCHLAHIRPDVNMGNLLKTTPSSQLFTVFGQPRVTLDKDGDEWVVTMEGVDIYDPVANTLRATSADKVAAWFLDGDYDGQTFCISQAFFPDGSAWDKLAQALKSVVDPARFAAFSGTRSLPFPTGKHRRVAVKVIDPRGNEVMRVLSLGEVRYGRE
ncbi:MAG: site-specific DNA-methyltransferase [Anaerolineae bacterium]